MGGKEVIAGNITAGNIAEFIVYVNMLTWPVTSVGWVTSLVQRASASQKRINEYLHTEPSIINDNTKLKRFESSESFLGALINQDNKINQTLRDNLYTYFTTEYYNNEHFKICLRLIFNKITDSNVLLFTDNILFILSRNVFEMTREIAKLLLLRESTNITERKIIETILSDPTGKEDYLRYFKSIDIDSIKLIFLKYLIDNFNLLIEETILTQKSLNSQVDENEFRLNDLGVIMMIFGIAYSRGYLNKQILNTVSSILDNYKQIKIIKPFGVFIELSQFDASNLNKDENNLITKFIQKYYLIGDFKDKYIIENILTIFVNISISLKQPGSTTIDIRKKQIDLFLNKGILVKPVKSSMIMNSNFKSTYSVLDDDIENLYEDDDDDDIESSYQDDFNNHGVKQVNKIIIEHINFDDDEEFEKFPEPNDKIIKIISLYFKSNDKINSLEDLKYFIEINKINSSDFSYGLLNSIVERTINDVSEIKKIVQQLQNISGFENLNQDFLNCYLNFQGLINILKCDNPMADKIACALFA